MTEMPEPAVMEKEVWPDLQPLLDQELSRLPDIYRVAIVLCDLEGKTRKKVAQQLGCPEGTVAGRLARARVMLAKRLAQRGVALSGGALAAVLSQNVASAGVPTSMVSSTIKAATMFAGGQAASGVISVKVAALTEGVLKAMLVTKLKIASVVVLMIAGLVGGAGLIYRTQAAEPQPPTKAEKPAVGAGGKPQVALKPIVMKDDATPLRLAWGADGKTVVTFGVTTDVVETKDADGKPLKLPLPNNTIKIWDAATGKLKESLGEEKHTNVYAVAFARNRETAAIAYFKHDFTLPRGGSRKVRIVNATTWESKYEVDADDAELTFSTIALSLDGKTLALGGWRYGRSDDPETPIGTPLPIRLKLWDIEKERLIQRKPKANEPALGKEMLCLAFSPDGKMLAAGDADAKIRLFDGRTGEPGAVLDDHTGRVLGIAFSPDGNTLASWSDEDKTVKLWDVPEAKLRQTLKRDRLDRLWAVAFSPDGKLLATAGGVEQEKDKWQSDVILWDAKSGEKKETLAADLTAPVLSLGFSPDGKTLAVASAAKTGGEISLIPLK